MIEKALESFDSTFNKAYVYCANKALENRHLSRRCSAIICSNKNFTEFFFSTKEQNRTPSVQIAEITFDLTEFDKISYNGVFNYLNIEEKKQYLDKQECCYNNDDYLYYDIRPILSEYARDRFPSSYMTFFKNAIEKRLKEIKEDDSSMYIVLKQQIIEKINESEEKRYVSIIQERKELEDKIEKLQKFIDEKKHLELNEVQSRELPKQLKVMKEYSKILKIRIDNFHSVKAHNTCVCCGKEIQEGRQICIECEKELRGKSNAKSNNN